MIPELGHFAAIVAMCIALVQGVLPLVGAQRNRLRWMQLARPAAQAQFVFVAIAFGCLTYAFVANDFSVRYVAANSNSALPLHYRVAAMWGSHEGSILLWTLMLTVWGAAVSLFSRHLPDAMVARILGVMGLIGLGFSSFMLFTSNPFQRLWPAAVEGRDLNPLLQDPGMVIHPPMLYMGYVGFSVAFAFAIAALLGGTLDAAWARWSRPWTALAWAFLTIGIAVGSAWAYYELGWGGWWFWDPVENASFMPWLVGTALIHSLAVTEKRASFKAWTVLLAIFAFSLSLLGTFLVRSGVLTSVHAFATDPARGVFILGFLVVVIGGSLALFAWRAPRVGLGGRFDMISRESLLLGNNMLLVVAAASILLGTLYPLFLDALGLGKISVGPPYFEAVFVPLMTPVVFLMGIGPLTRWKGDQANRLASRLRWAVLVSALTTLIMMVMLGRFTPMLGLGLVLALWIVTTCALSLWQRIEQSPLSGLARWKAVVSASRSFYGMLLAHVGVGVFIVGVTLVRSLEEGKDVRMRSGDRVEMAGRTLTFEGIAEVPGPNYIAARATLAVAQDGRALGRLYPEKRLYRASGMPMTEAAIDSGLRGDLYVALAEAVTLETWIVRVYYKPFVDWIWGGCVLMALGGLLALTDRRYRVGSRQSARQAAAVPGAIASTGTP
ncbi:MAG TPA: heme lyase CcmF/NrfE family subunit [Burkholderiales bacterium]|nr:heme lyase CcmF/NrfE family subunit [Burkholderiales bacterium]